MTQIVQAGSINPTALQVPGAYIQIQPPSPGLINGAATNVAGAVGTAIWGPVNSAVAIGSYAQFQQVFGALQNRLYDLGSGLSAAALQGANNFRCVRVTDGTDVAASVIVQSNCLTLTGKCTGSLGNSLQSTIAAGSKANTFKITMALPGLAPETYDNIAGSANALWVAMAAAINTGISGVRGASNLVIATAGAGTAAPTMTAYTLAGGTDGATTITGATLVGTDGSPRSGMYALRGTGCAKAMLVDCSDSTTWGAQVAYGLSEGTYMVGVTPPGDTITGAATAKASVGIDSYAFKLLVGDWCYWADPVNQITRLISPQGFALGALAAMPPQNSSLNTELVGIVATQSSQNGLTYSAPDLQQMIQAGLDIVANPSPGGAYFACQSGRNTSSNAAINGDNYTTMTNYEAQSIGAIAGKFVGSGNLQTTSSTDPWRRSVKAAMDAFMQAQVQATPPQLAAFSNQCDLGNNLPPQIALGYGQVNTKMQYLSVVQYFIVNMQGGQGVQVTVGNTVPVNA